MRAPPLCDIWLLIGWEQSRVISLWSRAALRRNSAARSWVSDWRWRVNAELRAKPNSPILEKPSWQVSSHHFITKLKTKHCQSRTELTTHLSLTPKLLISELFSSELAKEASEKKVKYWRLNLCWFLQVIWVNEYI